eukprot:COSAG05_NODE_11_length_38500_cov_831.349861_27_plen_56_part_00
MSSGLVGAKSRFAIATVYFVPPTTRQMNSACESAHSVRLIGYMLVGVRNTWARSS